MKGRAIRAVAGVTVIGLGMLGLAGGVEYGGWILFVGCLVVLS